ncbi:MAG: hypothetical protein QXO00_02620 [Candidatus Bathyarchaeia archaeon]
MGNPEKPTEVFSPYAIMRQNRIKTVLKYIAEKKKVNMNEIVGKFCIEWGLRSQRIREYLEELKAANYVEFDYLTDIDNPDVLITEKGAEAAKNLRGEYGQT